MSLMRTTLIGLSRSRSLQNAIVRVRVSRRMARRFVAGETLEDAKKVAQLVEDAGAGVLVERRDV